MATEDLRLKLEEAQLIEGNNVCADCGHEAPDWAAINIGIFLCIDCAGIHRRLGTTISKIKSIKLDRWTHEMIESMINVGNKEAKKEWESKVPLVWPKLTPDARLVLREQWIRAKYERKEFVPSALEMSRPYLTGLRQGFLYKRKKKSDEWNTRYFVLDHENLSYFINSQDRKPKACVPLLSINVTFNAPGLEDHNYSLLITYRVNGRSRGLFVYSDTGHEIMDWYLSIRCAKLKALQLECNISEEELLERVTWDFTRTGYLFKMPPTQKKFQRRFFVLDKSNLRYYDKPKDAYPLGEIQIGASSDGFAVTDVVPDHLADQTNIFMLCVPYRSGGGFPLMAETEEEKKEWMSILKSVIEGPPAALVSSDEYATYEDEREHSFSFTQC